MNVDAKMESVTMMVECCLVTNEKMSRAQSTRNSGSNPKKATQQQRMASAQRATPGSSKRSDALSLERHHRQLRAQLSSTSPSQTFSHIQNRTIVKATQLHSTFPCPYLRFPAST